MKDIKCPLCGGKPEYILEEGDGHCEYAGCPKCGLYAAPSWGDWNCNPNEEDTWQRWRDLVSKFPPIMRVQVGDNLTYFGTSDFVTVVRKDAESCEIQIETPEGELYIIEPKYVHKWPWELEQKEGGK